MAEFFPLETKSIKGSNYEAKQVSLLYVFVSIFYLDRAHTTKDFEICYSNWPIETFLLRNSTVVWRLKQRIVHGRGPSNIKYSTFVINFEHGKFS